VARRECWWLEESVGGSKRVLVARRECWWLEESVGGSKRVLVALRGCGSVQGMWWLIDGVVLARDFVPQKGTWFLMVTQRECGCSALDLMAQKGCIGSKRMWWGKYKYYFFIEIWWLNKVFSGTKRMCWVCIRCSAPNVIFFGS
jgi:hypothetical protein